MVDASPATGAPRQSWGVVVCYLVFVVPGVLLLSGDGFRGWLVRQLEGVPPETESLARAGLEDAGWEFPAWNLDEGLLEEVVTYRRSGFLGPSGTTFLEDDEGGGELLLCFANEWRVFDQRGERGGVREVDGWGGELARLEGTDGASYVLEQRGDHSFAPATEVICRRDGEVVWRRKSRQLDWHGSDPIRLDDGRELALLFGFEDWLAVHPNGEVAWDRSGETYASYMHSTHPALPGRYLAVFGDLRWHRAADGSQIGGELDPSSMYAFNAVAVPGPLGEPLAFAVGAGQGEHVGRGVISVFDEAGEARWVANAPDTSFELARIDRADGSSLFVVAAKTGDLFVIDAEGTALHHRTLPQEPREDIGVAIYELDAGPLGADHIGIAVTMLEWIAVYRLPR